SAEPSAIASRMAFATGESGSVDAKMRTADPLRRAANTAAADTQAVRPRETIGEPAAEHIGDSRQKKWQRSKQAALQDRKSQLANQIRRQPREIEVQAVRVAEVHDADRVQVAAGEYRAPR